MNEHPLQFFKSLVEQPSMIHEIKMDFFPDEGDDLYVKSDWNEEYVVLVNVLSNDPPHLTNYFADHLKHKCQEEQLLLRHFLDKYVLDEEDHSKANVYLKKIISEIDFLIAECVKQQHVKKYPFINEILQSIKEHLVSKYHLTNITSRKYNQVGGTKIQWLGKTNVLTTLFYDLLNGQDKGEPYIHANKKDVMKFLLDNFLDKEGNELSESTIQSYFDKQEKKAKIGDRIELPNKRATR